MLTVRCSPFDGGSTQTASDGGAPVDVVEAEPPSTDGGNTEPDTGAPCLNDPLHLCDDFDDRVSAFDSTRWSGANGSSKGLLQAPFLSPPNAMFAEVTDAGQFFLTKGFSGAALSRPIASLECELAFLLSSAPTPDYGIPLKLALGNTYTADLHLRTNSDNRPAFLKAGFTGDVQTYDLEPFTINVWYTISVRIPDLRVRVNGAEKPLPADAGVSAPFLTASAWFGLQTVASTVGWGISIDNVRCTATPAP